jgi:hypothetical protein
MRRAVSSHFLNALRWGFSVLLLVAAGAYAPLALKGVLRGERLLIARTDQVYVFSANTYVEGTLLRDVPPAHYYYLWGFEFYKPYSDASKFWLYIPHWFMFLAIAAPAAIFTIIFQSMEHST